MGAIKYLYQFIPEKFEYLTKIKVIQYKEVNLKTAYLVNIIHELILKFYFSSRNYIDIGPTDDIKFNLWSPILRRKYGMHYNIYIDYLIEKEFITLFSNYYVGKKAKTYEMNYFELDSIKKIKIYDNILIKKSSREYLMQSITSYCNSPIDPEMRKKLVDDLYHIQIDHDKSIELINKLKDNGEIEMNKFYKNQHSIDNIKNNNLFFKFDEYGRFHTNFTILKKEIRQNYLTIDNDEIIEIDVNNSQPLFLALLLQEEINPADTEVSNFIWLAREGLFYDFILGKFPGLKRKDVKLLTFKVLFGHNSINSAENKIFSNLFPLIYNYVLEYKNVNDNYKCLAHTLQKMESDFIFGKVVKELYEKIPDIRLFTVHDSILFPIKYKKEVIDIFERCKKELF